MMHTMDLRRGSFGWYALCLGCPEWQGHPELVEADAKRHYRAHAAGRVSEPVIYMSGEPERIAPVRAVNVDRLVAWVVGPVSVLALAWWVLWTGGVL